MVTVEVLHTARVPARTLVAARRLVDEALAGDFGDADWTMHSGDCTRWRGAGTSWSATGR